MNIVNWFWDIYALFSRWQYYFTQDDKFSCSKRETYEEKNWVSYENSSPWPSTYLSDTQTPLLSYEETLSDLSHVLASYVAKEDERWSVARDIPGFQYILSTISHTLTQVHTRGRPTTPGRSSRYPGFEIKKNKTKQKKKTNKQTKKQTNKNKNKNKTEKGQVSSMARIAAGAYPGFCSMKRIGVLTTPPGWDASPSQVTPSISSGFPDSLLEPICTPGWREVLWE